MRIPIGPRRAGLQHNLRRAVVKHLRTENSDRRIVLDVKDLTLAGRDVIGFLGLCEADGITIENCAIYVREWITRERRGR